jgi:hypothetical protein
VQYRFGQFVDDLPGMAVISIKFAGSFPRKYVLPALVPEMSYEGMAVATGRLLGWLGIVGVGNLG